MHRIPLYSHCFREIVPLGSILKRRLHNKMQTPLTVLPPAKLVSAEVKMKRILVEDMMRESKYKMLNHDLCSQAASIYRYLCRYITGDVVAVITVHFDDPPTRAYVHVDSGDRVPLQIAT